MPLFEMVATMKLEGLAKVVFDEGDGWVMTLKCTRCGHVSGPKPVSSTDECEMSGSRGTAHYVQKCHECRTEFSVNVDADRSPGRFDAEENEHEAAVMVTVECRGCEPEDGEMAGRGFSASTSSGSEMEGELDEEGCWADVDEETCEGVGVMDAAATWRVTAAAGKGKGRRRK